MPKTGSSPSHKVCRNALDSQDETGVICQTKAEREMITRQLKLLGLMAGKLAFAAVSGYGFGGICGFHLEAGIFGDAMVPAGVFALVVFGILYLMLVAKAVELRGGVHFSGMVPARASKFVSPRLKKDGWSLIQP